MRFDLTVNTITQIPDVRLQEGFSQPLRDDQTPNVFFYKQNDEELTTLHIYNPLERIDIDPAEKCSDIGTKVYACIGTLPSKKDLLDIDHLMSCHQENISTADTYTELQLDSSNDKISSGNVFLVLVPDFTNYTGSRSRLSDCEFSIELYRNEQISHFNKEYLAQVNLGFGVESAKYFMADIPIVTSN